MLLLATSTGRYGLLTEVGHDFLCHHLLGLQDQIIGDFPNVTASDQHASMENLSIGGCGCWIGRGQMLT
jgi:hypothetical protein